MIKMAKQLFIWFKIVSAKSKKYQNRKKKKKNSDR